MAAVYNAKNEISKSFKDLEQEIRNINMFKKNMQLTFSTTLKHANVDVVHSYLAKSVNSSAYKFSLLEPHIPKNATNQKSYALTIL